MTRAAGGWRPRGRRRRQGWVVPPPPGSNEPGLAQFPDPGTMSGRHARSAPPSINAVAPGSWSRPQVDVDLAALERLGSSKEVVAAHHPWWAPQIDPISVVHEPDDGPRTAQRSPEIVDVQRPVLVGPPQAEDRYRLDDDVAAQQLTEPPIVVQPDIELNDTVLNDTVSTNTVLTNTVLTNAVSNDVASNSVARSGVAGSGVALAESAPAAPLRRVRQRQRQHRRISPVAIVGAAAAFGGVLGIVVVSRSLNDGEVVAAGTSASTVVVTTSAAPIVTTTRPVPVTTTPPATTTIAPTTTRYSGPGAPHRFTPLDYAGDQTFAALADGSIQVAFVYSSQARVAEADLVVLEDDRSLQVAQHLVPVARSTVLGDIERATLDSVSAALTTADLRVLNLRLSQGVAMEQLVREWLHEHQLDSGFPALSGTVRVGSVDFAETELVARLYAGALAVRGMNVTFEAKLGSRAVVLPKLESGTLDLTAEYSSAYLTLLGGTSTADLAATMTDLQTRAAARGLWVGAASPAQDADAIAVTKATAAKYQLTKVSELAQLPDSLSIGGPPDCLTRPTCIPGLQTIYGITVV
jgi:osmoprotectant transport system substrate-binding protein